MKKMKKKGAAIAAAAVLFMFPLTLHGAWPVSAGETDTGEPENLYAQSAVLMDADSGRILFSKNGQEERAMASTTKIMTCILALENGDLQDEVTVSDEAAAQPKVKLGMRQGQSFYLNDLLYSLMLESHNDSAVAIAEHIGGSVEEFADLMNAKAKELGCSHTYFITPNGLDARDQKGIHHTTAADLAAIMRYCIMDSGKKEEFLKITQTESYQFSDCEGNGSYSCQNHNSFLRMMEGALSGKTGFTSDAGYCYVGALRRDDRTFIVALLACGWPNNKGYKWSDTRRLMTYGLENYEYRKVGVLPETFSVKVRNGVRSGAFPGAKDVQAELTSDTGMLSMLLGKDEDLHIEYDIPESVEAPVEEGEKIGRVIYFLNEEELMEYPVRSSEQIGVRTFSVCFSYMLKSILL